MSPADADDLAVGQITELRFPSVRERGLPIIEGRISRVSADSFTDEKTGAAYFTAEVVVPPGEMDKLKRLKSGGLRAGLPAEVIVPLHKRTMLQYLLEPLSSGLWRSFREH